MGLSFNERVEEKLSRFDPVIDLIADGGKKMLIVDALRDYCYVDTQLDDVNEDILEVGTTVINSNGNVARNPDLQTQHAFRAEKAALMAKLLKALPDGEVKDALAAFAS